MTVIVADMGATNARLAYISKGRLSDIYRFACDDFKGPTHLIESFMHSYAPEADNLLLGVPGIILNNKVKWTNRKWELDAKKLQQKLGVKHAILMNDLEIQGTALSQLTKKEYSFLQGNKFGKGPKFLLNIGTGLGCCYIIDGKVFSSEYGQTLLSDGKTTEALVSGPAFKSLYHQLTDNTHIVSAVKISELCLKGDSKAIETYAAFYKELAHTTANLALTLKATGGIYLCGGILDKKTLQQLKFISQFRTHPTMTELLKTIPVAFIKQKDFAFLGLKALAKKFDWS